MNSNSMLSLIHPPPLRYASGFHSSVKGELISISDEGRKASRSNPEEEFDQGLVFSSEPLPENELFEVRFLSKVPSWSGSLEIGLTSVVPEELKVIPPSSKELPPQTWTLMENSVLLNGCVLKENYGSDLDNLEEGDTLGVLISSSGEIIFYAKGVSLGPVSSVSVRGARLYAFVNIYGKCASVCLTAQNHTQDERSLLNDLANSVTASNITSRDKAQPRRPHDRLRFHERKGLLIKLSNQNRTCERRRPLEEFNNGVVMTHRPLLDEELFEIRIDTLVDKWSGSIEVGMTAHNPNTLDFPSTMTNQRSGTLMMSGCGILTNGKGTKRGYGSFNLDELKEGDRIGMIRKKNGALHFYINGEDQGVASAKVPSPIWGVVDLYGLTVKVTIVDDERNLEDKGSNLNNSISVSSNSNNNNRLLFHNNCGSHAAVIGAGSIAHRPNAGEEFNFGVVLSNRPLLVNEVFEIRLDKMVTKWAGSIEIGVTTHSPLDLDFPSTMTNIRSGTWMMTGNGVMHNGTTIIDDYGHNLDKLRVGDRVAVVRKENGTLHFFVNSEDQGPAALNIPEKVYGVIDLYGQAAQVSILDVSELRCFLPEPDDSGISQIRAGRISNEVEHSHVTNESDRLRFHHLHGRNARISNGGLTASRPNALGEFNDAIVMSNRPLRTGEHFEILIERVVERWSGSIEVGVSLIRPEDLDFPNTMTDIHYDTWMLSGSALMQDGQTVRNGYCVDLDSLGVGSRLGMMRTSEGSLLYTINGFDQGLACESVPQGVFAVIDLYGQCAQVSIVPQSNTCGIPPGNSVAPAMEEEAAAASNTTLVSPLLPDKHKFDPMRIGKGLRLKNSDSFLTRLKDEGPHQLLALGAQPLEAEDIFEVRIEEVDPLWAGSIRIGITGDQYHHEGSKPVYLEGSSVYHSGRVLRSNICSSLERLAKNDKIGVRRTTDGLLKFIINSEESQVSVDLSGRVWPFVELIGSVVSVSILPAPPAVTSPFEQPSKSLQDSLEVLSITNEKALPPLLSFHHENHGRNIQLSPGGESAKRTDSYNQGIIISNRALSINELFGVSLSRITPRWSSSLMIGILGGESPERIHFPVSALSLKKNAWIISGDGVYQNGVMVSRIPKNIDDLKAHDSIGIQLRDHSLHLVINEIDLGPVIKGLLLPSQGSFYGLLDIYGKCEEVRLLGSSRSKGNDEEEDSRNLEEDEGPYKTTKKGTFSETLSSCEYLKSCKGFKASLGLPRHFFSDEEGPSCFCGSCVKALGLCSYGSKGDPSRDFGAPLGWARFPLRSSSFKEEGGLSSTRDWHQAYHPTKPAHIRKILDKGNLIPYHDLGLEQRKRSESKEEEDNDGGSAQFLFSPTLSYISSLCSSSRFRRCDAKMALQVDITPGSYKAGPPTAGALVSYDPHFKMEETEWLSKERGNTRITGILIYIEYS